MSHQIRIGLLIMLQGMLGVFAVSVFLILSILLINLITSQSKDNMHE